MNNEKPFIDIPAAANIAADQLAEVAGLEAIQNPGPQVPVEAMPLPPVVPQQKQEPRPANVTPFHWESVKEMSDRFERERSGHQGAGYAPRLGRGRTR